MFMDDLDWNDPKFGRWHLSHLPPLTDAQHEALWDDSEIDDSPITEDEQIELCQKFDCKVELFHSNVCNGVEKSWPKKYFGVEDFKSLSKRKQKRLQSTMTVHAVELYNKYVDPERTRKRIKHQNEKVFAPYREERRLRHRFERIKKIGENKIDSIDQIILEEANNTSVDEGPRSDNQKKEVDSRRKTIGPRSKRPNQSAKTSKHENDINLENMTTHYRRITRSAQTSASSRKEVSFLSDTTTPDRRITRSTSNTLNVMENENELEIVPTTPIQRSTNVTKATRSKTKNATINTNVTLRRRKLVNRPNDTSDGEVSDHVSLRHRQIPTANVSADNQQSSREDVNTEQIVTTSSRRSNRLSKNISPNAETTPTESQYRRLNKRKTSNKANQTVVYTQSTQSTNFDSSFDVDTPSIESIQLSLDSFTQNIVCTPKVIRQAFNRQVVTNKTPEIIIDEYLCDQSTRSFNNNATEEINSEDFDQLGENQTSTQKEL